MLQSSLCDYSDAYILVSRTITVVGAEADIAAISADKNNQQHHLKFCTVSRLHNLDK